MVIPGRTRLNLDEMSEDPGEQKHELFKDPIESETNHICAALGKAPPGAVSTLYKNNEDCLKKKKMKGRGKHHNHHHSAKMHLTRSSDVGQDIVSFQVEQPNRVAVRLEFLMETPIVRLNDKEYMKKLYNKLNEEERMREKRHLKIRETKERERVKQLVVSGKMIPPDDLHHLYQHPVFRVNAMLQRLQHQNLRLYSEEKVKVPVVAIEPFEFDPSGKFFSHLHKTQKLWVPSEEKLAQEEKLQGKIERAKQRLVEKRHREAEEAKAMRMLFKSDDEKEKTDDYQSMTELGSSATPTIESDDSQRRAERARMQHTKPLHHVREDNRMAIKDRKRRELLERRERDRRARQEARMKERDKKFFDEKEDERERIIERHQQRMYRYDNPAPPKVEPPFHQSALGSMFRLQETPPDLEEDESFKRLRKNYNLRGSATFDTYRPPDNPLIAKYLDTSLNSKELFANGKAVKGVYDREMRMTDDYMIKLYRMM